MNGSVRRSQLITTYGVGSIVAVDDESVMVLGLDHWPIEGSEAVVEPRLHIDGKRLVLPPGGSGDGPFAFKRESHIPVTRFPRWYYCSDLSCRRLDRYGKLADANKNICKHCGAPLIPSRFVAACAAGHIEDFPYWAWVHSGSGKSPEGEHRLELRASTTTGSLAAIFVHCRDCDIERSLDGAFDKQSLLGVKNCSGAKPWLGVDESECERILRVCQRGASNVWFPNVRTALSIPPWSDGVQRFIQRYWDSISSLEEDGPRRALIKGLVKKTSVDYTVDEVEAAVKDRIGETTERDDGEIRAEEFRALCHGRPEHPDSSFVAEPTTPPAGIADFFDLVTVVSRLREVRVFHSFTRLEPTTDQSTTCAPAQEANWLPAIPVLGEGVFLRLNDNALQMWEKAPPLMTRRATLDQRWKESFFFDEARGDLTLRFLLAHTLAHAVIDQWSLAGGYPAASLRERVYSGDDGTGILVYTAAADSAGSLGGVIAQAEPGRLEKSIVEAVQRYSWCSSDPVCSETTSQGIEGLNLAACHSCALLPETSCEHRNTLLDRALVVGVPTDRSYGFFRSVLED